jgi:hypothetical protein
MTTTDLGQWHVILARRHYTNHTADRATQIPTIQSVWIPTLNGKYPLQNMILAQWPTTDPQTWHQIRTLPASILGGWPPITISPVTLQSFKATLQTLQTLTPPDPDPAPCSVGDTIMFNYFAFNNTKGHVIWIDNRNSLIGTRIQIMGRDQTLMLPYAAVLAVLPTP